MTNAKARGYAQSLSEQIDELVKAEVRAAIAKHVQESDPAKRGPFIPTSGMSGSEAQDKIRCTLIEMLMAIPDAAEPAPTVRRPASSLPYSPPGTKKQ